MNETTFKPLLPRSTPEAEGISSADVERFVRALDAAPHNDAFRVVRHGKVIAEGSWAPSRPGDRHMLFSLSKSFTSSAIGIAQGEGLLCIDDALVSFFPEYDTPAVSERMRRVTPRHLLTMSSGHRNCAFRVGAADDPDDWVRGFLESALDFEPGTHFTYNTGATYMLSAVLQKVTGTPVVEYLQPRLFDPLGIPPPRWDCCPRGINLGGTGLHLSVEEIAAFAHLWLRCGNWSGRQIIPPEYAAIASSFQIDNLGNDLNPCSDWNKGYGFQFWMCRHNSFRGDGYAGQIAFADRAHDLAVAITGGSLNMQREVDSFLDILPQACGYRRLPENPAALASLRECCASLRVSLPAPTEGATADGVARDFAKYAGTYAFGPNRLGYFAGRRTNAGDLPRTFDRGLKGVTVGFGPEGARLRLKWHDRDVDLVAGYGTPVANDGTLLHADAKSLTLYAQCAQVDAATLAVGAYSPCAPTHFDITFRFADNGLDLDWRAPNWYGSVCGGATLHGERA